jgi:orotate phosphoribosyltransferase
MKENEILQIFKEYNALLEGHFRLSSGLHSSEYLQCALLLQYPKVAEKLCRIIAEHFKNDSVGIVAGPAIGGIIVAYEVARALNCRCVFTEREEGRMTLRRGFDINPEDRVLVVEDVITTGGSAIEVLELVKQKRASIIGVGSIVDRSAGNTDFGTRFFKVFTLNIEVYKQEECPLCKKGIPVLKPGSRK